MIERQQKMKLKTLKRKNKYFYMGVICGVMLLTLLIFNTSRAKYRTTQSIELARGTINYTVPDLNLVSMYIEDNGEYKASNTVPSNGYKLNQDKSYCAVNGNKNNSITILYSNSQVTIGNLTQKGTKCYLYFDVKQYTCKGIACETIMANMNTWKTRSNFDSIVTDTTTGVIYKSLNETQYDDDGETYYFAGAPTDNWVKFGGYYWRIIRINGNGTIRMIFDGTTPHENGTSTTDNITVANVAYNEDYEKSEMVGWTYTLGEQRGNSTSSNAKTKLEEWYNSNLKNYDNYIAAEKFCNDRETNETWESSPEKNIIYSLNRLNAPTFKCSNQEDALNLKAGLITMDEIAYAGGQYNISNAKYYLYNGQAYWTMSPSHYLYNASNNYRDTVVYLLMPDGGFYTGVKTIGTVNISARIDNKHGLRLVINLKADTQFTSGNGTSSNPYTV